MSFLKGLSDFFSSLQFLSSNALGRAWFISRLWKALLIAFIFSLIIFLGFGGALAAGFYQVSELLPYAWLDVVSGALLGIIFVLALYFSLGPIVLLIVSLSLSQWGEWSALQRIEKLQIKNYEEHLDLKDLFLSILRALGLGVVIAFSAVLGLFPPLLIVTWFLSSYAIGREWVWTSDELYMTSSRRKASFLYCAGLGAVPALLAGIPVLGVVSIPILQLASLFRYRSI